MNAREMEARISWHRNMAESAERTAHKRDQVLLTRIKDLETSLERSRFEVHQATTHMASFNEAQGRIQFAEKMIDKLLDRAGSDYGS